MALVDLKHSDITLSDGSTPANAVTLKVGEGTLSYTEHRPLKYTADKGRLDEVVQDKPQPMDVKFDAIWSVIGSPQSTYFADGTKQTNVLIADHLKGILSGEDLYGENLVSITQVAGTATVVDPYYVPTNGDSVTIRGAVQTEYNGTFVVSNVVADGNGGSSYDIAVDSGAVSPATGTVVSRKLLVEYTSSDADLDRPYACDIKVAYKTGGGTSLTTILLPDFRYEQRVLDMSAGTISVTGKCFATDAIITEEVI